MESQVKEQEEKIIIPLTETAFMVLAKAKDKIVLLQREYDTMIKEAQEDYNAKMIVAVEMAGHDSQMYANAVLLPTKEIELQNSK